MLDRLEERIAGLVRKLSRGVSGTPQGVTVLELRRDILSDLKGRIQAKGRGEYLFPYRSVIVRIAATDEAQRELYESAFVDEDSLRKDAGELLTEVSRPSGGVEIVVVVVEDAALAASDRPFRIDYHSRKPRAAVGASRPAAKLIVLRGEAEAVEHVICADRCNMGRMAEVVSGTGGVIRRNDVAFAESESTVAREHAYIRWDRASGKFRLCDHLSGDRGTRLFREGRSIAVPKSSTHGVQLQPGDEIHLGNARLRFEVMSEG